METKVDTNTITQERLERLGLKTVAKNLNALKARAKKMMLAYEHYRYLTPEKIQKFQDKLRLNATDRYSYQQLNFTPLEDYVKIPPEDVLLKLEEALEHKCFDRYEVAHIVEVKKDPLLLGIVDGCRDKFFIGQWDNDVRITDLLKDNEG